MNFCNRCGNQLKPDSKFCSKCGQVVKGAVNVTPVPLPRQSICTKCGAEVVPGVKFCKSCGAPAQSATVASPPVPQHVVENIPPRQTPPHVSQATQSRAQAKLPANTLRRKRGRVILVFAVSSIILLAIIATFYFYQIPKRSKTLVARVEYMQNEIDTGITEPETVNSAVIPGKKTTISLKDGSLFNMPAGQVKGNITFEKISNYLQLPPQTGFQITGCLRAITVDNLKIFENSPPKLTIPSSQIGNINPVTIMVLRIDSIIENKDRLTGNGFILPVTINSEGNIEVTDNFLCRSAGQSVSMSKQQKLKIERALLLPLPQALDVDFPIAKDRSGQPQPVGAIQKILYAIITFQSDVNWVNDGKLFIMLPDRSEKKSFRKPWDLSNFDKTTHPITNIYILVHGHNEKEKGGFDYSSIKGAIEAPWLVNYKQDVWTPFYRYYLDNLPDGIYPSSDCNLVLEFIYPSYRPIFSNIQPNSNQNHQTLGEQLGQEINDMFETTPRLRHLIDEKVPFNLYIISHSMGGLVARSGLRYINQDIYSHFRKLASWGTPHDGSPLVSMSYVIRAGYKTQIPGFPQSRLIAYAATEPFVQDYLLLDTPGSRDLRADRMVQVNFSPYFTSANNRLLRSATTNLVNGTDIYNTNLELFNKSEPAQNQDKFVFFYGINQNSFRYDSNIGLERNLYAFNSYPETQKGTFLMDNLLSAANNANDGAVPIYSAQGIGLPFQPVIVSMGSCDHEEFFTTKGEYAVKTTLKEILDTTKCSCPEILDLSADGDTVTGRFQWGIYTKPGIPIKKIETTLKGKNKFSWKPDGTFMGEVDATKYSENKADSIFVFLTDGSKIGATLLGALALEGEWEGTLTCPDGQTNPYHVFFKKIKNINSNLVILYVHYWARNTYKNTIDEWGSVWPYEIWADGTLVTYSENWLKPEICKYIAGGNSLRVTFKALPIKPIEDVDNVELDPQSQFVIRSVVAKRLQRSANYIPSKEYKTWPELVKGFGPEIEQQLENFKKYKNKYQEGMTLF